MKIKLFSGLSFLSLGTIVNADVLDIKIEELKKQGFDVKVEEIKQKVYSHDEFEKKKTEENKRIIDEILRLDNKLKQVNQVSNINNEVKKEANKKNSDIDRENERRTTENSRLMKDWMEKVRDIKENYKLKEQETKEINDEINKRNEEIKKDYEKELVRIKKTQSELGGDYERQKRDIAKINEKIKSENDDRIHQVNNENSRRTDVYNKEKARIAKEYADALNKYKAEKNRIEAENAEILKNNKAAEEKFRVDTDKYNREVEENKRKKEEYLKKVEAAKVEDARKKAEYDKAKEEREKVEAKNSGDIAKINAENEKIKARNAEKEAKYKKELEAFNNKKQKLSSEPVVYESNGLKLVGYPDESARKSKEWYRNFKMVVERDDVEILDGVLGYNPESEIVNLTGGAHIKENDINRFYIWTYDPNHPDWSGVTYKGYAVGGLSKGSSFTLTNVGRTKSGKTVNLKYTMLNDYVNDPTNKIWSDLPSYLLFGGGEKSERDVSIGVSVINMDGVKFKLEFIDDNGVPMNIAMLGLNSDIDYTQGLGYVWSGGKASNINYVPSDSKLKEVNLGGKTFVMDYARTYDDSHGFNGLASTPEGTFLNMGAGNSLETEFLASSHLFTPESGLYWANHLNLDTDSNRLDNKSRIGVESFERNGYIKTHLSGVTAGAYFDMFGSASNIVETVYTPKKPVLEELIPLPKTPNLPNLPEEPIKPTEVEEPKYKDPKLPEKPIPKSTNPLPVEPVREKDPILNLIKPTPGRPEVPGTPPPVVPNSNPRPIFDPNVPGEKLLEPKKPELSPLLPKMRIPTDSVNATRGSVIVKKYVFEYLNSSQGTGIGVKNLNSKKSAYGNSLTLRNLN